MLTQTKEPPTWIIEHDTAQSAASGDMDIVDLILLFIAFMTYPPISFPIVGLIYIVRWSPVVEPIVTGVMLVSSGEVEPTDMVLAAFPHVAQGQRLISEKKQARLTVQKAEIDEAHRLEDARKKHDQQLDYLRQERQAITESQTLVQFLYNSLRTFLTGTTGSGKSVVMWNLGKALSKQGFQAYVADLKSDRDGKKWPFAHKVAGYGYGTIPEAFDDIEALFKQWLNLMSYRAEQQSMHGVDEFPPAVLIIDEANMIGAGLLSPASCKTAFITAIETTLRLGRELNMGLFMAAQDDQVENLGIEGKSAMLRNFNYRVEVIKVRNIRKAVVLDGQKRPVATFNVPELFDPITLLKKPSQKAITPPKSDSQASFFENQSDFGDSQASFSANQGNLTENQPNFPANQLVKKSDSQSALVTLGDNPPDNQTPAEVAQMLQACKIIIDSFIAEGKPLSGRKIAAKLREDNPSVNEVAARWITGTILKTHANATNEDASHEE